MRAPPPLPVVVWLRVASWVWVPWPTPVAPCSAPVEPKFSVRAVVVGVVAPEREPVPDVKGPAPVPWTAVPECLPTTGLDRWSVPVLWSAVSLPTCESDGNICQCGRKRLNTLSTCVSIVSVPPNRARDLYASYCTREQIWQLPCS